MVLSECVVGEAYIVRDGVIDATYFNAIHAIIADCVIENDIIVAIEAYVDAITAVAADCVVRNHVVVGGYMRKTNEL